jgi:hypothetical protein
MKKSNPFRKPKYLPRHLQNRVMVAQGDTALGTYQEGSVAQNHRKSVLILWSKGFVNLQPVFQKRWHRYTDPTLRAVPGAWYGLKDNGENDWEPMEDRLS